jgi:hypothetical protein
MSQKWAKVEPLGAIPKRVQVLEYVREFPSFRRKGSWFPRMITNLILKGSFLFLQLASCLSEL